MTISSLLTLSVLLLVLVFACGSDERVVATRLTAEIDGILAEEGGCLRVLGADSYSRAPVWHKEIFKTERRGDAVLIVDLLGSNGQPSSTVIWRLGDMIRGGGGATSAKGADDHAGAGFSERCAGPYFVVHSVR